MPSKTKFDSVAAIKQLSSKDPVLGKMIKKVGKFSLQLEPIDSPFHALAESIAYQQLTGKAAATIFGRVVELFESPQFLCPHEVLAMSEKKLRSCGLSGSKTASIKDLAAKTIEGIVPDAKKLAKMDNEEIIERLTVVRGIGPWTVDLLTDFVSTVFLTLASPMTIFTFIAIFAAFRLQSNSNYAPCLFGAGIFVGSGMWWLVLTASINIFRNRLKPRTVKVMNFIWGLLIIGFGLKILIG